MASGFFGKYRSAVSNNRVRVPAKFKDLLGQSPYYAPGKGGCFLLMPEENAMKVFGRYFNDDPYIEDGDIDIETMRSIRNQVVPAELDAQSRFSICAELKDMGEGLEGAEELVFAGAGSYIEVWAAEVYDRKYGAKFDAQNFENLIKSLRTKLGKEG